MLNRMKNINSEQEAKFIQDRIASVERNVACLSQGFGAYSRKAARLRDKNDELANAVLAYSESEDINKSLSQGLSKFSDILSAAGGYGDKRVQNIETKIVAELAQYEGICKNAKDEVKQIFVVRDKEVARKKALDKVRDKNPRNRQQIVQAETELVQATSEVIKTMHGLEEEITTFERQKLHDVKAILLDFVSTELGYHAKVLELLTEAYNEIYRIDEQSDLEDFLKITGEMESEFKKSLRLPDTIPHSGKKSHRNRSLGSLSSIFSTPRKKSAGQQSLASKRHLSRSENEVNREDSESDSVESEEDEDPFIAKQYTK
ncbi:PREDICTED: protein FAM92A1 isoform X2 [Nicrophorus vespilloides]|uniref:Protein FAM92A1 isoform X2 n=1 Tax=Nicrophorus vespilloides TaxID=110193 RepID=A0ABM1N5K2_NICVS|nr:PREDICTED: protein FAM92A1 isoform X2 [Nicrophorus vespilloides]